MANVRKLLEDMNANPRDWRISHFEVIAKKFSINVRKTGGSHVIFEHPNSQFILSVPNRRPIKPIYVKKFLSLIDEILESDT